MSLELHVMSCEARYKMDPAYRARLELESTCPDTHPHSLNCYQRHKCRCEMCRAENAAHHRRRRRRQAEGRWSDAA